MRTRIGIALTVMAVALGGSIGHGVACGGGRGPHGHRHSEHRAGRRPDRDRVGHGVRRDAAHQRLGRIAMQRGDLECTQRRGSGHQQLRSEHRRVRARRRGREHQYVVRRPQAAHHRPRYRHRFLHVRTGTERLRDPHRPVRGRAHAVRHAATPISFGTPTRTLGDCIREFLGDHQHGVRYRFHRLLVCIFTVLTQHRPT